MNPTIETAEKPQIKSREKARIKTSGKPPVRETQTWYTCAHMVF